MIRQYCSKIHMVHRIKWKGCKTLCSRYDPPSYSTESTQFCVRHIYVVHKLKANKILWFLDYSTESTHSTQFSSVYRRSSAWYLITKSTEYYHTVRTLCTVCSSLLNIHSIAGYGPLKYLYITVGNFSYCVHCISK